MSKLICPAATEPWEAAKQKVLEQFPTVRTDYLDNVTGKLRRLGSTQGGQIEVKYVVILVIAGISDALKGSLWAELIDDQVKDEVRNSNPWITVLLKEMDNDDNIVEQFSSILDVMLKLA